MFHNSCVQLYFTFFCLLFYLRVTHICQGCESRVLRCIPNIYYFCFFLNASFSIFYFACIDFTITGLAISTSITFLTWLQPPLSYRQWLTVLCIFLVYFIFVEAFGGVWGWGNLRVITVIHSFSPHKCQLHTIFAIIDIPASLFSTPPSSYFFITYSLQRDLPTNSVEHLTAIQGICDNVCAYFEMYFILY